jgi:cytochrome c oxidase cbb3-type subunit 3/ubiquinol-cytochrome c reductase cytochrome c subunit
MPAFATQLNERQIDDLVAAIRAWKKPVDAVEAPPYVPNLETAVMNRGGAAAEFTPREGRYVPVDEVKAALDAGRELVLLDARPVADYVLSHISGAVGIPFYEIGNYLEKLPKDVWIIAYCGCPHAVSGQAVDALRAAGFAKTAVLDEGFYVWEARGYPVTRRED